MPQASSLFTKEMNIQNWFSDMSLASWFDSDMLVKPDKAGSLKYFNDTSHVAKPLKYWNGVAWIEKLLWYWNGSTWVLSSFTPALLSKDGAPVSWYDPSDLSTMFTTSVGATQVASDGDPVGLLLDKGRGLALGSELVASPYTGASAGLWTVSPTQITRNGATTAGQVIGLNTSTILGQVYKIKFTVTDFSGDGFTLNSTGNIGQINGNGTYERFLVGNGGSPTLVPWAGSAGQATITNISIKEIAGNHLTQTSSSARPQYKTSSGLHWLEFDGVNDRLIGDYGNMRITGNLTIQMGVYKNVGSRSDAFLACQTNLATINAYELRADNQAGPEDISLSLAHADNTSSETNSSVTAASVPIATRAVIGVVRRGIDTKLRLRKNSATEESVGSQLYTPTANASSKFYLGSRISDLFLAGRMYQVVIIGRILTDDETNNLLIHNANKTGINL